VWAAARPTRLATDPPVTSTPSLPSGSPQTERSQSSTTSSTVDGPDPPVHEPVNTLKPDATRSPKTLMKLLGLPIRAKNLG
jgi:hypothetical protein